MLRREIPDFDQHLAYAHIEILQATDWYLKGDQLDLRRIATGWILTRAAFLSARNDAVANVAIIAAGLLTAFLWASAWPDLIVGLGIAAMNADAAREVWQAGSVSV